jgi:hypothetical protein
MALSASRLVSSSLWHLWLRGTSFLSAICDMIITDVLSTVSFMICNQTPGPDKNAYYHEFFLRGKDSLANRIPRIKIKGTGARKPSSPESEPNFYQKPFLPISNARRSGNIISPYAASLTNIGLIPGTANHVNNGLSAQNMLRPAKISSIEASLQLSLLQPATSASFVPVLYSYGSLLLASQGQPSFLAVAPDFPSQERFQMQKISNAGIGSLHWIGAPVASRASEYLRTARAQEAHFFKKVEWDRL